jgi:hypothetical protein
MPDSANALIASIRIDIEPTDPKERPSGPCAEESFSGQVEPIRAVAPLLHEPADDTRPEPLTVSEQVSDIA